MSAGVKRVVFVLSQTTSDGEYEVMTESHGFTASDIKDDARSLSDCTTLDVRKAALGWASQQEASGPDSPRIPQLGMYVDSNVSDGKLVRLCTEGTWKQTLASFKGTLVVYLCAEQLVKAVRLQQARANRHTRSPLEDMAVELNQLQNARMVGGGDGGKKGFATTPNVTIDKKRGGPGDNDATASSGASGAADGGARSKAARADTGSAHGGSALRRGALSNDSSSDDGDDGVARDRHGGGRNDDADSEGDDSGDSDVDSEFLSETDSPAASAASAAAKAGGAAVDGAEGGEESAEEGEFELPSEDEVEDLESDQERDPIAALDERYNIDLRTFVAQTGEEREHFCGSVECGMGLEGDELREFYLSRLSESARWDELFVLEGRGDASRTMRHPVLAQHGLEAKLQASREAVAHLPRESGVNAFPNPRVAYCGFCQKHVAVSRLGSLDSLKKHMVERHHPCLGGVLDGSTPLADMEDPPEGGLKPHHSSAAQCCASYKVAPKPSVAIKDPKYMGSLPSEKAFVLELPEQLAEAPAAVGGSSAGGR